MYPSKPQSRQTEGFPDGVIVGVGVGVGVLICEQKIQSPKLAKPYGPVINVISSIPIVLLFTPTYEIHEIIELTFA